MGTWILAHPNQRWSSSNLANELAQVIRLQTMKLESSFELLNSEFNIIPQTLLKHI